MPKSQNGWSAGDPTVLDKAFNVNGVTFPGGVRRGDVSDVLKYVATQFHARVEPLVSGWCWGYNYRVVTGSTSSLSNHASGTAIDINAPKHPYGVKNTFNATQQATIRRILGEVAPAVRWGGDYTSTRDDMHFEINASESVVAAVAARIRSQGGGGSSPGTPTTPTAPTEEEDYMIVKASQDDYVSVPCNGKTTLFISSGFGRKVTVLGIAAVKDNNGQNTPSYTSTQPGLRDINPDQPGPISIGSGCRVVQLRYKADHEFTVWCA